MSVRFQPSLWFCCRCLLPLVSVPQAAWLSTAIIIVQTGYPNATMLLKLSPNSTLLRFLLRLCGSLDAAVEKWFLGSLGPEKIPEGCCS
jgi:hypothetical protein